MHSSRIKEEMLRGSGREEESAPFWYTLFFVDNRLRIYSCEIYQIGGKD
jgi:hypothetical protein